MKENREIVRDFFWRYMTNFWSVVTYATIIYDFIYEGEINEFLSPILVIYIAFLTIFVSAKEFQRWNTLYTGRHPGEIFVILWTILIVGLFLGKIIWHREYVIPSEVLSTYIAVLSIMAITKKSKTMKKRSK